MRDATRISPANHDGTRPTGRKGVCLRHVGGCFAVVGLTWRSETTDRAMQRSKMTLEVLGRREEREEGDLEDEMAFIIHPLGKEGKNGAEAGHGGRKWETLEGDEETRLVGALG